MLCRQPVGEFHKFLKLIGKEVILIKTFHALKQKEAEM
jgi:hypothetical protein